VVSTAATVLNRYAKTLNREAFSRRLKSRRGFCPVLLRNFAVSTGSPHAGRRRSPRNPLMRRELSLENRRISEHAMAEENDPDHASNAHRVVSHDAAAQPQATHEELLAARLPPQERNQPDPVLQLSVGRLGAGWITLVAVLAVIIIAVVLYGLNSPAPAEHATAPAAASNAASAPAAGGGSGTASGPQHTPNGGHK
jgi:hypothetical protein